MGFLMWLEQTGFAAFVRDNPACYWNLLFFHALGLSIVAGVSTVVAIRVLGFPLSIPLASMERLFSVMWFGFAINAISGSCIFASEAADKALNPYFLFKMLFIALAVVNMWLLKKKVFRDPSIAQETIPQVGRILAGTLIVLWLGATIAGRLIAYSS